MVLKSKNIHDPYIKTLYSQAAKTNVTPPRNSDQRKQGSPKGNRFDSLNMIHDAWDEIPEISGKRGREKISPQPQRISSKKIRDRSGREND